VGWRNLSRTLLHPAADVDPHFGTPLGAREGSGRAAAERGPASDFGSGRPVGAGSSDDSAWWNAGDETSGYDPEEVSWPRLT
jgi:hypothetical protein